MEISCTNKRKFQETCIGKLKMEIYFINLMIAIAKKTLKMFSFLRRNTDYLSLIMKVINNSYNYCDTLQLQNKNLNFLLFKSDKIST